MNVHWCLLFVGILVILFSSIQIDSSSPTMAKGKRANKAAKKRSDAHSRRASLYKEKINKNQKDACSERKVKSRHPTYRGKQSEQDVHPTNGGKQSKRDVPTSKALLSEVVLPVKVRSSKAYKCLIYQYPSLL